MFLCGQFGAVRFCFNKAIYLWNHLYKVRGMKVSIFRDIKPLIARTKKSKKYEWLSLYDAMCLQEAVRHANGAASDFMSGKKGFPRFKSRYGEQSSYHCTCVSAGQDWIRVPKIGRIKAVIHRPVEGKVKSITLSRDRCGDHWASILIEDGKPETEPVKEVRESDVLGIDLGLKDLVITSNDDKIPNPKHMKQTARKVRRLQRTLSRRKKGSANREKARRRLAKTHRRLARIRADGLHKTSRRLVDESQAIICESLKIKNMMRNHHLAGAISDAAWGELVRQILYKAKRVGKTVVKIDTFFPSSKTCSHCGWIFKDLTLAMRSWSCTQCGTHHDRDVNAAVNIRRQGIVHLKAAGLSVLRG